MLIETPGFFDLQVNGFSGVDFNDPALTAEQLHRAVLALRATGVTRFLPTLITSPPDHFARCARTLARCAHPALAGIHMEGPYISPEDGPRGAHPRAHVRPASIDDFRRRQDAAEGRIVLVTLAPEADGALELAASLTEMGVRVAIGHTGAGGALVGAAVAAGAVLATHLGNGCAQWLPRHPNLLWEQLADDRLLASFIVDGHHLPPATVKAMVRAKTPGRALLVTDAVAAAGCPPGRYRLGESEVELGADGRVAMPGAAHLGGSALTMDRALANTVAFTGLPLEDVLPMATTGPAGLLGLQPAGRVVLDWDAARGRLGIVSVEAG